MLVCQRVGQTTFICVLSSGHLEESDMDFVWIVRLMEEIRLTSLYGKYPIIYRVPYMSGGAGFLPSTVAECIWIL